MQKISLYLRDRPGLNVLSDASHFFNRKCQEPAIFMKLPWGGIVNAGSFSYEAEIFFCEIHNV